MLQKFYKTKYQKWLLILSIAIALAGIAKGLQYFFLNSRPHAEVGVIEIDWNLLGHLDYVTGNANSELKNLDGKFVKIPGFMVPFEDNSSMVKEFLLVPTPGACIHVPPPPPNQMIFVKMRIEQKVTDIGEPIWIYGVLRLKNKTSVFGDASFEMEGSRLEPYSHR